MSRSGSRRIGMAFVEFALVLPIFVFLLLGVLQYARLVQATEMVTNLSREGARFASLGSGRTNAQITQFIQGQIDQTNLNKNDFQVTVTPNDLTKRLEGAEITVALTYNLKSRVFLPLTRPMLNAYIENGGDPKYVAKAVMRIVNA